MKRTIALVILAATIGIGTAGANTEGVTRRWACQRITVSAGPGVNLDYLTSALRVVRLHSGLPFELVEGPAQVTVVRDMSVNGGHAWTQHGTDGLNWAGTVRIGPKEWRALYAHEFGHIVGLDHSTNRRELMHESASAMEFSPAEQAGLRALGCPMTDAPLSERILWAYRVPVTPSK